MDILISGIVIFFGMHLVPSFGGRGKIITALGEGRYLGMYAVISMIGFILIIYGKSQAGFQSIWLPPVWGAKLTVVLMVLSFILLTASNMQTNIKRFTRHPMLWGVTLWSVAHLLANGDFASILWFGSFGIFSLVAMLSANIRGAKKQQQKYAWTKDVMVIIAGLVIYGVFIFLHSYLFGVAVI